MDKNSTMFIDTINEYCGNEMRKLKRLSDKILLKFGGINDFEKDDFYSIANMTVYTAALNFDPEQHDKFEVFLRVCLERKFATKLRDMRRDKRCRKYEVKDRYGNVETVYEQELRLNAPIGEDEDECFVDVIEARNVEDKISSEMVEYLKSLTPLQKSILLMKYNGSTNEAIIEKLRITESKFEKLWRDMTSFEKVAELKDIYLGL